MMPVNHKKQKSHKVNNNSLNNTKHVIITHRQALLIVVVILTLLNIVLFSAVYKVQTLNNEQNRVVALNETKTYNNVTMKASDIKTETGYIMGIAPNQDEKIISVHLDITNKSGSDFNFYPTIQTFIRDNQGGQYIMTPVELSDPFTAVTITPNETKSGRLSYLVTNRAVPLFLYIESQQPNAGPFVIKLQ